VSYGSGMADKRQLRDELTRNVADRDATAPAATRKAALANEGLDGPRKAFVDKVTRTAYKVTPEDIEALKAAGVAEDEIFELAVCAAIGEANRQLDAAMLALDAADTKD
jgi:hypothetical protein